MKEHDELSQSITSICKRILAVCFMPILLAIMIVNFCFPMDKDQRSKTIIRYRKWFAELFNIAFS